MSEFRQYRRKQIAELVDWAPEFDMTGVSVSDADKNAGSPKLGDRIARNPANHADRWLVAADYFSSNFEPVTVPSAVSELVGRLQYIADTDDARYAEIDRTLREAASALTAQQEAITALEQHMMANKRCDFVEHAAQQQEIERLKREQQFASAQLTSCSDAFSAMKSRAEQAESTVAALRKKLVSEWSEDVVPTFRQGEPIHELEDLVTAERCAGLVKFIGDLRRQLAEKQAKVEITQNKLKDAYSTSSILMERTQAAEQRCEELRKALDACERYMTEKGVSHEYPVLINARAALGSGT